MIYIVLYSMLVGDQSYAVNDLFNSASLTKDEAEKLYSQLILTNTCFAKSLWQIDSKGVRKKLEYETYYDEMTGRNK